MTSEGAFPKIARDTFYASEYNNFNKRSAAGYIDAISSSPFAKVLGQSAVPLNQVPHNLYGINFSQVTPATSTNLAVRAGLYRNTAASITYTTGDLYLPSHTLVGILPFVQILEKIDDCDNSSIDATIWDSSGASESNAISCSGAGGYFRTKVDLTGVYLLRFELGAGASGGATLNIKGSTSGTVGIVSNGVSGITHYYNLWLFEYGANDIVAIGTSYNSQNAIVVENYFQLDVSSLVGNRLISFDTGATAGATLHGLYRMKPSPTTALTVAASKDSGSNYTNLVNNSGDVITWASAATTVRVRMTATVDAAESLQIVGVRIVPIS